MIRLCKAAGVPAPQFRQDGGQFVQTLRRLRPYCLHLTHECW